MKRYIDYKLKSDVIKAGLHKQIGFIDSSDYLLHEDGLVPSCNLDELYFDLCNQYDYKWIKEARKINIRKKALLMQGFFLGDYNE